MHLPGRIISFREWLPFKDIYLQSGDKFAGKTSGFFSGNVFRRKSFLVQNLPTSICRD